MVLPAQILAVYIYNPFHSLLLSNRHGQDSPPQHRLYLTISQLWDQLHLGTYPPLTRSMTIFQKSAIMAGLEYRLRGSSFLPSSSIVSTSVQLPIPEAREHLYERDSASNCVLVRRTLESFRITWPPTDKPLVTKSVGFLVPLLTY